MTRIMILSVGLCLRAVQAFADPGCPGMTDQIRCDHYKEESRKLEERFKKEGMCVADGSSIVQPCSDVPGTPAYNQRSVFETITADNGQVYKVDVAKGHIIRSPLGVEVIVFIVQGELAEKHGLRFDCKGHYMDVFDHQWTYYPPQSVAAKIARYACG
jgi:hypothetical protein